MTAIAVFCFLSLLLVAGKLIRLAVPILQKLYLPSSVIGGAAGLLLISLWGKYLPPDLITYTKKLPGFLINVIFAALFLGTITPRLKEIFKISRGRVFTAEIRFCRGLQSTLFPPVSG